MGRSRKCNWKRKQLKANKKKGTIVLTGKQYWDLHFNNGKVSPDTIVLKNRRGSYVIGYSSESKAKKAYDAMKKALEGKITEDNFLGIKYPYGEPEKLRGLSPDFTQNYITADGRFIDPELGDINVEEFKKYWDLELKPKFDHKSFGIPIIFGTAGSIDEPHWAHEIYKNGSKDDKLFIAAGSYEEEAGPFPELNDKEYFELAKAKSRRCFGSEIFTAENLRRAMHPDGTLPKDFFEYDPNGRNK